MLNSFIKNFDSGYIFNDQELLDILAYIEMFSDSDEPLATISYLDEFTNIIKIGDRYFCIYEHPNNFYDQPFEVVRRGCDYYPIDKVR